MKNSIQVRSHRARNIARVFSAFCREPRNNPTEKLSVTAERIGQHWAFLENYLSVASNAALLKQAAEGTDVTDVEELTLRSANNLLQTLRKSPPISGTEMELCHKALSTLSDMCDDGRSALTPSLQAGVVDFIADCLNEIAERTEKVDVSILRRHLFVQGPS